MFPQGEKGCNLSHGCLAIAIGDTQKLFDKETNQHEEQILRAQLAASHLQLLIRDAPDSALSIVYPWLLKLFSFFQEIIDLMERTKHSIFEGRNVWFGDLTYSPDVFLSLYQISLGFWAVQGSQQIASKFSDSLTLKSFSVQSLNPHPLLACLWNKLSVEHQANTSDTNLSWFERSAEGFDPCFLRAL